ARFARALDSELRNITEPNEGEAARTLASAYQQFLAEPTGERARALQRDVRAIYDINERAILHKDKEARSPAGTLQLSILALLVAALAAGLAVAVRAARAIAAPLGALTAAVAGMGQRGPYPRLVEGDYEEARTLAREFNALAARLEAYEQSSLDQ